MSQTRIGSSLASGNVHRVASLRRMVNAHETKNRDACNGWSVPSIFSTPAIGLASYSETVLHSGTVRGRIGYAPDNWLFYATGGFAWTYDQLTLTQLTDGTTDAPFLWRLGWVAGLGIEWAFAPNWTANVEYLFTKYGNSSVLCLFPVATTACTVYPPLTALRIHWGISPTV